MSFPCSFAFAFAFVLINSKPAGVSVEEHVLTLRKSLYHSQGETKLSQANAGNTCEPLSFSGQQPRQPRARSFQQPSEKLGTTQEEQSNTAKRSLVEDNTKDALRMDCRSKRQKTSPLPDLPAVYYVPRDQERYQVQVQTSEPSREQAHMTHEFLNRSEPSCAISAACNTILQILSDAQDTEIHRWTSSSQVVGLGEVCQATMKTWSSIISILSRTHDAHDPDVDAENTMSLIASVMHALLEYLRLRCFEEAERRNTNSLNVRGRKATRSQTRLENDFRLQEVLDRDRDAATSILKHIIATSKELGTGHSKLIDAITGSLLHHIGEVMMLLILNTFNPRSTPVESILSPVLTKSLSSDIGNAVSAARIEGPYLVELLACLVQISQLKTTSGPEYKQLEKFQRELLRAVLGNENIESISKVQFNIAKNCSAVKKYSIESTEKGKEDWFLGQVWDLLGWDILLDN